MGYIHTCMDCKDRTPGCHSVCEKYLKARRELDELNEKRAIEERETRYYIATQSRNHKKIVR